MDVSKIGGFSPLATSSIRFDKSTNIHLMGAKSNKNVFDKGAIDDNFSHSRETAPAYISGESYDLYEASRAGLRSRVDAATGEEKKDLEMRLYWGEYNNILSGGNPTGWRNVGMDTMYSQAAEIYKQIEESSDSEDTKTLKHQALKNALKTGTSMYSMIKVGEKMKEDALEAKAQGKIVDRSYRSKAKFDKLSELSGTLQNITSMFFNGLKSGKVEGVDYGAMITDAVNKMMSYKHSN